MELRRLISVIRPWLPLLGVSVLLAGGAAFVISGLLPKTYEAKATLIVGQSLSAANPDINQLTVSQRLSATYATIATKGPILDAVIAQLALGGTSTDLAKRVRADAAIDSTLLTVSAQDPDPARAAAIANAIADQIVATSPTIQGSQVNMQSFVNASLKAIQSDIEGTQTQIEALSGLSQRTPKQDADLQALEDRLINLRSTLATFLSFSSGNASNLLTVFERAVPSSDPISPNRSQNTFLAAAIGLLLAGGVVFLAEHLNDGIRDPDAVLDVTGLSTFGSIVEMKGDKGRSEIYRLAALLYPRSGVVEAYRALRTNIEFSSVDRPIKTLLVTSSIPGEGKTVTAANLAVVFAQAGRRVLLVDADLRKPGLHLIFNLPNTHGLTTMLRTDEVTVDAIAHATEQENLRIITTGPLPPNPAELAGSQRMRTVLSRLTIGADLIIFDSAPLQAVTDSAILSSFLDGTLFVIDARHSRRRVVRLARETLAKADANVLGTVLNRVPARAQADYAGYYGYYSSEKAQGLARVPDSSAESPASPTHQGGTG